MEPLEESHDEWTEYFGVEAATYKQQSAFEVEPRVLLRKALASYRRAADLALKNHWALAQAIGLGMLLNEPLSEDWFELAAGAARFTLDKSVRETIWSYSTLLELAVLHESGTAANRTVRYWSEEFVKAFNRNAAQEGFSLRSTRRQLLRYTTGEFSNLATPEMKQRAVEALSVLEKAVVAP